MDEETFDRLIDCTLFAVRRKRSRAIVDTHARVVQLGVASNLCAGWLVRRMVEDDVILGRLVLDVLRHRGIPAANHPVWPDTMTTEEQIESTAYAHGIECPLVRPLDVRRARWLVWLEEDEAHAFRDHPALMGYLASLGDLVDLQRDLPPVVRSMCHRATLTAEK